jgi:hypothetical protein
LKEKVAAPVWKAENTTAGIRGTLYPQKLALTFPTTDGRSVGIVLSRSEAAEFFQELAIKVYTGTKLMCLTHLTALNRRKYLALNNWSNPSSRTMTLGFT